MLGGWALPTLPNAATNGSRGFVHRLDRLATAARGPVSAGADGDKLRRPSINRKSSASGVHSVW